MWECLFLVIRCKHIDPLNMLSVMRRLAAVQIKFDLNVTENLTNRKAIKAKRPMVTQRSSAQVGECVHRTTGSRALHKSGLYGRVARRKLLLKERRLAQAM